MLSFDPFFRDVARVANQMWDGTPRGEDRVSAPPLDAWRNADHLVIELDLPGITPGSLDVAVEHDALTVRAERPEPADNGSWQLGERPYGVFTRRLALGHNVDVDGITADYTDGVLRLSIPVAEAAKPRKIPVGSGPKQAISA